MADLRLETKLLEVEHPLLFAYLSSTSNKHLRTRMLKNAAEQYLIALQSGVAIQPAEPQSSLVPGAQASDQKKAANTVTSSKPAPNGKASATPAKAANIDMTPPRLKIGINASDNLDSMERWS